GAYHNLEQRRALLDDLVFRHALVRAAREAGLDRQAEVRRALDTLLASRYLQRELRDRQKAIAVSDDEVRARFDAQAAAYAVPPRRRIAVLRLDLPEDAGPGAVAAAEARLDAARREVAALPQQVRHFGAVAQKYSDDVDSRHRGGVAGWIAEAHGADAHSRLPEAVLAAARALGAAGELSPALRSGDALYLVRLVDRDQGRARGFEE